MAFSLEPLFELRRFSFFIPSYQRGYRWDKDQVWALLNDLKDFITSDPAPTDYYCLQPIVVQPIESDENTEGKLTSKTILTHSEVLGKYPDGAKFIVIDGQQRLTTLYLLMKYFNSQTPRNQLITYSLSFNRRPKQTDFINRNKFMADNDPDNTYEEIIDNFYLRKAYDAIEEWFEPLQGAIGDDIFNKMKIMLNEKNPDNFIDIRIIWYELPGSNPIAAFDSLNYGSIRLTGTELVKAMLLASNGKNDKDAINRGHVWDRMEKSLQDPLFWSMLRRNDNFDRLSHIEFILDLVADEFNDKLPKEDRRSRSNDEQWFDYYVIDTYFRNNQTKSREELVDEVWKAIETTFNQVRNWYDNPRWFHYIGLWSRLTNPSSSVVNQLKKIEKDTGDSGKKQFEEALRREVGGLLKTHLHALLTDLEKEQRTHPLDAERLDYRINTSHKAISEMLLAFNVMSAADGASREQSRFPFHLYDLYKCTSLEHIYPQNINSEMTPGVVRALAKERIDMAKALHLKLPEGLAENLEEKFSDPTWNKEKFDKGEDDPLWMSISADIKKLDDTLGEYVDITDKELHSIGNLALVDQPTNSALSNDYLHVKREKLNQRNNRRLEWEMNHNDNTVAPDGTYIMPATAMVFAKHFTAASSIGDMRLWRKEDRTAYLAALKATYNRLTK
ncbi:MAG: DUF262 domain-containing HNH endonuclease family protein [Duncaniella sp.]|nr:DUF262 domain-containing HNH endonuclease family protein [Duncaniella sp.]